MRMRTGTRTRTRTKQSIQGNRMIVDGSKLRVRRVGVGITCMVHHNPIVLRGISLRHCGIENKRTKEERKKNERRIEEEQKQ